MRGDNEADDYTNKSERKIGADNGCDGHGDLLLFVIAG
jgi:hypothetical protein